MQANGGIINLGCCMRLQNGAYLCIFCSPPCWPAADREIGPSQSQMAEKWPAAIFQGFQDGRKMAGQIAGQQSISGYFLPGRLICVAISKGYLWDPLSPRVAAGHRHRPFLGYFWFWACFPFCSRPAKFRAGMFACFFSLFCLFLCVFLPCKN